MKYFLTGATGFVGGRLAQVLRDQGYEVVALVRNPAKAGALKDIGVQLAAGDITDKASLRDPMMGVDGVFHVAAWYKVGARDSSMAYDINVNGTRHVLEVMGELNIPKGVYTSTLAIYGDTHGEKRDESYVYSGEHVSVYDRTKWQAHYEVAVPMTKAGLPLVIVQPGAIYGPGDTSDLHDVVVNYLKGGFTVLPQGMTLCWAHVGDIVQGHLLAMEKGRVGESYIICGPCHSLEAFFELVANISGRPTPRIRLSPGLLRGMAGMMNLLEKVLSLPPAYTSETLRTSAGTTYLGDNSKARRELGYNPRPLEDGLRETLTHEMSLLGIKPSR
jgi:nucleoside-diphosphate-sugar epimerase